MSRTGQSLALYSGKSMYPYSSMSMSLVLGSSSLRCSAPSVAHQCSAECKDHLPWLCGNVLSNAAQNVIGPPCHKGTCLAHVQLVVHQKPQVLCSAAFQPVSTQPLLVIDIISLQMQDLVFPFAELHEIPFGPFLHLVQGPSRW